MAGNINKSHIRWDKEAKAYECECGYLQGERDSTKADAHEAEYFRIAKAITWGIELLMDKLDSETSLMNGIWPVNVPAKPGQINDTPYKKPIASDFKAKEVLDYIDNFDNAGRHISDIDRALGIEPKPKRKWYYLWLK